MSGQHDLPESFVLDWMRKYEDKVLHLEELNADKLVADHKLHTTIFSDAQTDRVEALIARAIVALLSSDAFSDRVTKEFGHLAGAQALRFVLWMAGSFILGAVSVAVAWIKSR